MTLATAPSFASFDITAGTGGLSYHQVLLDAMFAKSRYLEVMGPGGRTSSQKLHQWVSLKPPVETVTAVASGNTDVGDTNASATTMTLATGHGARIKKGTLLVNISKGTPIGTYLRNEIIQVTDISGDALTVVRDAGSFNSGTGSALHGNTDVYRILYDPTQEGSVASDDPNTFQADDTFSNYCSIHTMKQQQTGSQKARAMLVQSDETERQWDRDILGLTKKRVSAFLYGYNATPSDTVIGGCQGLLDFMVDNIVATNPLIDYTSTTLTYKAVNDKFIALYNNGADINAPYKIVTTAVSKDVMSTWDADKVTITRDENTVGREIVYFKSSMGFLAEIIAEPQVFKSDLFIVDPTKVHPMTFREFEKDEWGKGTSAPNGDDMWYRRTIGEETLEVFDPGTGHAALTGLTWI